MKNAGKKGPAAKRPKATAKKADRMEKVAKSAVKPPAKKSPLSKAELAEFRQMLLVKRRDLVGDMNGIQAEAIKSRQSGSGDLSNMPTHLADIGTDNFEHEFSLGLLESERTLLKEIDEALDRIDNNTFGICLGTGEPIGKARLRARPWAKYCIEYARKLEKGLVRPVEELKGAPPGHEDEPEADEPEEAEEEEAEAPEVEEGPEEEE